SMPHLLNIEWDYADRMQHAHRGGDVYFTYDAAGNRVRKIHVHTTASTSASTGAGGPGDDRVARPALADGEASESQARDSEEYAEASVVSAVSGRHPGRLRLVGSAIWAPAARGLHQGKDRRS